MSSIVRTPLIIFVVSLIAAAIVFYWGGSEENSTVAQQNATFSLTCSGMAACMQGTAVTNVVDGDTLDLGDTRVRLSLVNTPERGQEGYQQAKNKLSSLCPIGTQAAVDEDDGQQEGSYGRMIGKVYCANSGSPKSVNELLLESGNAVILTQYCDDSEFSSEDWAQKVWLLR